MTKEEADEIIELLEKLRQDIRDFKAAFEKENAELKKQLAKAKEIIKILLKYDRGQFFDDRRIYEQYIHTRGEAEQFLKEVENV